MWSDARQALLESHLARITASANLPLSWVENLAVLNFFSEFLPPAEIPSRKVLTNRLIPDELRVHRAKVQAQVSGADATGICDGWTGVNSHHYIVFMLVALNESHIVTLHDASDERKTADILYDLMLKSIEKMEQEYKVNVIGYTTDSSGESKKARKMLARLRPDLIILPCHSHQVSLLHHMCT
ncbi:hypothetical protein K474DRAFT_1599419 [Panus rudis PR-1116 ss-1]|nr:hypothetical protein K474DRAFT_1599419 [Panus rudis PR-1116 ss-1]